MKKHFYPILIAFLFICVSGYDQGIAQDLSVENILKQARRLSEQGNLDSARQMIDKGLQKFPENYELNMQMIRIFGWSGDYTLALNHLEELNQSFPVNQEIHSLKTDLYYWAERHDSLLYWCNNYLVRYGINPDVLFKKAIAQYKLGEDEKSLLTINDLIKNFPEYDRIEELKNTIKHESLSNNLYMEYFHSLFNNRQDSWHTGRLGYARDYKKGTVTAAVSTGKMYDKIYQQVDVEWYQQFNNKWRMMAYGQYVFNPVTLENGYGARLYYQIISDLEIGAGGRYLTYTENEAGAISGIVSKSIGNYYISFRSNLYFISGKKINYGGVVSGRKYFDSQQWVGLTLNYGYLFFEPAQSESFYRQNSGGLYCHGHIRISGNHYMRGRAGIQREPLVDQDDRLRYFMSIGYWLKF